LSITQHQCVTLPASQGGNFAISPVALDQNDRRDTVHLARAFATLFGTGKQPAPKEWQRQPRGTEDRTLRPRTSLEQFLISHPQRTQHLGTRRRRTVTRLTCLSKTPALYSISSHKVNNRLFQCKMSLQEGVVSNTK
jgi:hypothetical protein